MKKASFGTFLGVILVAAIVAALTVNTIGAPSTTQKQTALDRVLEAKVIKAGWFEEPPFTLHDPNTGARTGIVPEIANQIAADYGIRIQWETIANFALIGEDLALGKYDVVLASLFNMPRGGRVDYADSFVYLPTYAYVRADETRFATLADIANTPGVRIAGQEGAAVTMVSRERFPKAEFNIIASADLADMLLAVTTGKADVAFMIPSFFDAFEKTNPGKIKPLPGNESLQTFSVAFGLKPGEEELKAAINNSLHRMMVSGQLADIFARHDPTGSLLRPTVSYTSGN